MLRPCCCYRCCCCCCCCCCFLLKFTPLGGERGDGVRGFEGRRLRGGGGGGGTGVMEGLAWVQKIRSLVLKPRSSCHRFLLKGLNKVRIWLCMLYLLPGIQPLVSLSRFIQFLSFFLSSSSSFFFFFTQPLAPVSIHPISFFLSASSSSFFFSFSFFHSAFGSSLGSFSFFLSFFFLSFFLSSFLPSFLPFFLSSFRFVRNAVLHERRVRPAFAFGLINCVFP